MENKTYVGHVEWDPGLLHWLVPQLLIEPGSQLGLRLEGASQHITEVRPLALGSRALVCLCPMCVALSLQWRPVLC